jgi:CubicO group peptidase (beta-lactamase class C family)
VTIVPWLSAGKPVTAALTLSLWQAGELDLDTPVAELIPEFGAAGKERVTTRHLLTHTAGFPNVDIGWPDLSWAESCARVCAAPLEAGAVPGETAAYHFNSSWLVLGMLIERLRSAPIAEALRRFVFEPLGMHDSWCGMPGDVWDRDESRIGGLFNRERGGLALSEWHTRRYCEAPAPGGNCRGPVRELGRFYQSLLDPASGLLSAETVAAMTHRERVGQHDATLQHIVDFGLGVILDSKQYGADTVPYGFGRDCSEATFGHGGSQCSIGFADPEAGLVVAWAANGRPGEPSHQRRNRAINDAISPALGAK